MIMHLSEIFFSNLIDSRILRSEPNNIEAKRMAILFLLCKDGKHPEVFHINSFILKRQFHFL